MRNITLQLSTKREGKGGEINTPLGIQQNENKESDDRGRKDSFFGGQPC